MSRSADRSDLVDLELLWIGEAQSGLAIRVRLDETSPGVWLPKSAIEFERDGKTRVRVTLPEAMATAARQKRQTKDAYRGSFNERCRLIADRLTMRKLLSSRQRGETRDAVMNSALPDEIVVLCYSSSGPE